MKNIILLTFLVSVFFNFAKAEVFYQKCTKTAGVLKCVPVAYIPHMKYKKLFLRDLKAGACYKRQTKTNKTVFFKIIKIKKQVIFALAQAVPNSNVKNFNDIIYVDNYLWEGENFNSSLEEFPCSETPTLGDNTYLTKNCNYKLGSTLTRKIYCSPIIKRNTYERQF